MEGIANDEDACSVKFEAEDGPAVVVDNTNMGTALDKRPLDPAAVPGLRMDILTPNVCIVDDSGDGLTYGGSPSLGIALCAGACTSEAMLRDV